MKVGESSAPATERGGAPSWISLRTSWPRQAPTSRKAGDEDGADPFSVDSNRA